MGDGPAGAIRWGRRAFLPCEGNPPGTVAVSPLSTGLIQAGGPSDPVAEAHPS